MRNFLHFVVASLAVEKCAAVQSERVKTAVHSVRVETAVGTVYGLVNHTAPDVAQFLGVPYAEPPVASLRFLPPQAKSPVASINATRLGAECLQNPASSFFVDAEPDLSIKGPTSEDCLTLNIWAPSYSPKKLPVLIWLHGGALQSGGGSVPYQIPTNWVQRTQAHIVVGINYRLNFFGFPNAAGLSESQLNAGLLDQRLGVEWVRSNIAAFGGDPLRMTLWGQSAGAESVDLYNFAYPTDPLVTGLIMDSGTAFLSSAGVPDPTHSNFTFVARHFNCSNTTAATELECMRKVSGVAIESFLKSYDAEPAISFNPVFNNITLFANYTERALAKNFTRLPAIIGTNANEGVALVPYNLKGPNMTAADAVTLEFLCGAVQTTSNRYAVSVPTYRYFNTANFSNISPLPWEGAYHCSELPLIFGTSGITNGESTAFELALSHRWQDLYLTFMRDPVNGLPELGWHTYEPNGSAVDFDKDGKLIGRKKFSELASVCNGPEGIPGAIPPT